jgi:hypothetical protein
VVTIKGETYWGINSIAFIPVDPVDLINALINDVIALNLHNGIENGLDAKLDAALEALDDVNKNNDEAAVNTLEAFIAFVAAQSGIQIPVEEASVLIAAAQEIIDALNCG